MKHKVYKGIRGGISFCGCDRVLFMSSSFVCLAVGVLAMDGKVWIGVLILWLVVFALLYQMGRRDLLLRDVYLRQLKYRSFYRAQGTVYSEIRKQ